jgi:small acid-soluble spore protein I (minor)
MNLNLRQAIIQRVQDKSSDELVDVIESSVGSDERSLPGLGVLFEIIWQHCEKDTQNQLAETLQKHIPTT